MATCTMTVVFDQLADRLLRTTVRALAVAEMDDAIHAIHNRLNSTVPRALFQVEGCGKTACVIRLDPFAELVLREMTDIAQSTADSATKDRRASEALSLAGYGL